MAQIDAVRAQSFVTKMNQAGLTSRSRSGQLKDLPSSTQLTVANLQGASETLMVELQAILGGWVH